MMDLDVVQEDCRKRLRNRKAMKSMKHNLSVQEFSMLPLQANLKIITPDGEGTYEGITSSGIVTVFIKGGYKQYSWSEVTPKILLRHVLMMEDFVNNWRAKYSKKVID
jgi:hypothetical protein